MGTGYALMSDVSEIGSWFLQLDNGTLLSVIDPLPVEWANQKLRCDAMLMGWNRMGWERIGSVWFGLVRWCRWVRGVPQVDAIDMAI